MTLISTTSGLSGQITLTLRELRSLKRLRLFSDLIAVLESDSQSITKLTINITESDPSPITTLPSHLQTRKRKHLQRRIGVSLSLSATVKPVKPIKLTNSHTHNGHARNGATLSQIWIRPPKGHPLRDTRGALICRDCQSPQSAGHDQQCPLYVDPYIIGQRAASTAGGLHITDNPYTANLASYILWHKGFLVSTVVDDSEHLKLQSASVTLAVQRYESTPELIAFVGECHDSQAT